MKLSLILLIGFVFVTPNCRAGKRYNEGDTLYVWAKDGVNVRSNPEGQIVAKIPYGSHVVVRQNDQGQGAPVEVIESLILKNIQYPGVKIYGQYVEVSFNDSSGYIFDAYLSKFPPIRCTNRAGECEDFNQYFSREFGILKVLKIDTIDSENQDLRVVYNNGITYDVRTTACCGSQIILVPDMSITEAFIFLNRIYNFEEDFKNAVKNKSYDLKVTKNIDSGSDYIREQYLEFAYTLMAVTIRRIDNYVIITRSGGD